MEENGEGEGREERRLDSRKLALIVISTNRWNTIRDAAAIISACERTGEETYQVVQLSYPGGVLRHLGLSPGGAWPSSARGLAARV